MTDTIQITLMTKGPRPRVYIAGPISKGNQFLIVAAGIDAWWKLITFCDPFCPHLSGLLELASPHGKQLTHTQWLSHDFSWLSVCHALLRLPGESVGADAEVEEAQRLGLPVFTEVSALGDWVIKRRMEQLRRKTEPANT